MIYKSNSVLSIISDILSGKIQNVVILTGAGISVASGIPDFRSSTGLYATLKPELLTATKSQQDAIRRNPTLVVDYDLFQINQFPYLEVRRNLILGIAEKKWKPTLGHYFMKVLNDKGILRRVYTQNIDGIDYQLELSSKSLNHDKIVLTEKEPSSTDSVSTSSSEQNEDKDTDEDQNEKVILNVHGTLHEIECESCHDHSYSLEEFCYEVKTKIKNIYDSSDAEAPSDSSHIRCKKCGKPQVKPATVMFGRSLPDDLWKYVSNDFPTKVDLLVIIGTSLQVSPANSLVYKVGSNTARLIINRDRVGEEMGLEYGEMTEAHENDYQIYQQQEEALAIVKRARDGILVGDCDEAVLYLLKQLGWTESLIPYQDNLCSNSKEQLEDFLRKKQIP
jgi:NAD-dependent deacetylase sirtuin 2